MFAFSSTESVIIFTASSISYIDKSVPQVIFTINHLAQAIESSSNGLSIADLAASIALLSQDPYHIPIKADQALFITDLISAKSKFTSPGLVIKSEIHLTH